VCSTRLGAWAACHGRRTDRSIGRRGRFGRGRFEPHDTRHHRRCRPIQVERDRRGRPRPGGPQHRQMDSQHEKRQACTGPCRSRRGFEGRHGAIRTEIGRPSIGRVVACTAQWCHSRPFGSPAR
jgi:hypothetical protein